MKDISNPDSHLLYSSLPNIIIGFHGCDKKVFDKILYEHEPFKCSHNDYDWLGNGMYFWGNFFPPLKIADAYIEVINIILKTTKNTRSMQDWIQLIFDIFAELLDFDPYDEIGKQLKKYCDDLNKKIRYKK